MYQGMEHTFEEIIQLLFDGPEQAIIDHALHILFLVLLGYRNVMTVFNQIDHLFLSKVIRLHREGLCDDVGDVVLEHPEERLVVVEVESLHVLDRHVPSENALVNSPAEVAVKNSALIQRLTDDPSDKLEEHQVFGIDATQTIRMESCAVRSNRNEQGVHRIEHAAGKNLEPFFRHTTCVDTLFADEAHVQFAIFQLIRRLEIQGLEGVQENLISPY